jgi:hypothetical protein
VGLATLTEKYNVYSDEILRGFAMHLRLTDWYGFMRAAPFRRSVCGPVAALLVVFGSAWGHDNGLPALAVQFDVEGVTLTHLDADGITARIDLSAIAHKSATLRSLIFERVTVNGVPVRVSPVSGPIRLKPGEPISGLSSVDAWLSYRDMETLQPLRDIIQDGKAAVHASVRGQLELSLLRSSHFLPAVPGPLRSLIVMSRLRYQAGC